MMSLRTRSVFLGLLAGFALAACGGSNTDPCASLTCDTPPADECQDASTLLEYAASGSCNPTTGLCEYTATPRTCAQGCLAGRCVGETSPASWAAAIETNDYLFFAGSGWFEGVGGYFADEPAYYRVLPHQLAWYCTPQLTEGSCTLYDECQRAGPALRFDLCSPPCAADEYCDYSGVDPTCTKLPRHYAVGTLTFEGLKQAAALTPDEYDRYNLVAPPDDLFDAGDALTVRASGGDLPAFSLTTTGVAPLEPTASQIELLEGQAAPIGWTPAGDGSRIAAVLMGGLHDPATPVAILCEADDSAGTLNIPAALVDGFRGRTLVIQKPSYLIRHRRAATEVAGLPVEFVVGSLRNLVVCFSVGCL